jgi:hypothetical protein
MRHAPIRARRIAYFCSEVIHFIDDELLHTVDRVLVFKGKVEFLKVNDKTQLGQRW